MTSEVVPLAPATGTACAEKPGDRHPEPAPTETPDDEWLPFQRLDVYRVAKEFVRLVHEAKITDAELRDQATRAAKRTFLGLCEGLPIEGQPMRRKYFNEANASLHETLGAVDLAATIGAARVHEAAANPASGRATEADAPRPVALNRVRRTADYPRNRLRCPASSAGWA